MCVGSLTDGTRPTVKKTYSNQKWMGSECRDLIVSFTHLNKKLLVA